MAGDGAISGAGGEGAERPHVLYLAHRVPYPPDKGDRIRTFNTLRWLAGRVRVHLACLDDDGTGPAARPALEEICERVAVVPVGRSRWLRAGGSLLTGGTVSEGAFSSPALRRVVREWASGTRFRRAMASASSVAPYLRLPELRGVPGVVDLVDVDSQKWLDYAAKARPPKSWLYRTEGKRLRRREADIAGWAEGVAVVSEAEADILRGLCPPGSVHVIPNGVALDYFRPVPAAIDGSCVMVGAMDYPPNVEGACWFVRNAWPRIRAARPESVFRIVGRSPAKEVRELAAEPGVEVVGQVPDVRPFVAKAAVAVVPLLTARGVQNKVLEALAMAKAVVASPVSLAALATRDGAELRSARTADEWVATVTELLGDPGQRERLGEAGRRYVERHHRWEETLEGFAPLLGLSSRAAAVEEVSEPVGV